MKFYRPLFLALVDCLEQTIDQQKVSTRVLELAFKNNKKWGSKDRKTFAEAFYDIVKWQLLIKNIIGTKSKLAASNWACIAIYYLTSKGYECEGLVTLGSEGLRLMNKNGLRTLTSGEHQDGLRTLTCGGQQDGSRTSDLDLMNESYQLGTKSPLDIQNLSYWQNNHGLSLDQLYSFPRDLHLKLQQENIDLEPFYKASQAHAPLFIRANTHLNSRSELKTSLEEEGIITQTVELAPHCLKVSIKSNVFRTKAFKEGRFEVQDGGSQQISMFLKPVEGDFIIDACAGAGGKSLHLSNLVNNKGRVLAMDIYSWKLEELKKRAKRNKCHNIETRLIDGTKTIKRLKDKADALLLDVPCTGSGVYRRNPDAKYKWTEQGLTEIQALQKNILSSYSTMVKTGGQLVYSTCSILPSENQKQIELFLNQNSEWSLDSEKFIDVGENDFDGYYMARLYRKHNCLSK